MCVPPGLMEAVDRDEGERSNGADGFFFIYLSLLLLFSKIIL